MEAVDRGRDTLGDGLENVGRFDQAAHLFFLFYSSGQEVGRAERGRGRSWRLKRACKRIGFDLNADHAKVRLTNAYVEFVF